MFAPPAGSTELRDLGADPFQRMPMFWKMNDTPTAVISGASFGAVRSRR